MKKATLKMRHERLACQMLALVLLGSCTDAPPPAATPAALAPRPATIAREVTLVLDASGAMGGDLHPGHRRRGGLFG